MTDITLFEKHTEIFNGDIGMYYCGKRIRTKNHIYGPEIRTHFLIVLVESGTATLYTNNKAIKFKENDMLIMFPQEKIFYKAETDWSIKWIGVSGNSVEDIFKVLGVNREYPIFTPENFRELANIISELCDMKYDNSMFVKCKTQELVYKFFSFLLTDRNKESALSPVDSALKIIKYNYNNNLSIKDIADSVFLDSAYFSRLFKKEIGISPKKFILKTRIEKSKFLLKNTDLTIKEISITVGFSDSLYFSKLFYKTVGMTPSEFRKTSTNL